MTFFERSAGKMGSSETLSTVAARSFSPSFWSARCAVVSSHMSVVTGWMFFLPSANVSDGRTGDACPSLSMSVKFVELRVSTLGAVDGQGEDPDVGVFVFSSPLQTLLDDVKKSLFLMDAGRPCAMSPAYSGDSGLARCTKPRNLDEKESLSRIKPFARPGLRDDPLALPVELDSQLDAVGIKSNNSCSSGRVSTCVTGVQPSPKRSSISTTMLLNSNAQQPRSAMGPRSRLPSRQRGRQSPSI
mmetsp:Transcript_113096/g.320057  ORF Transcript_113096/g.320057 Transcript_113096/m.320057 type:complete len:244 (+) Transcript_113096:572-1303(+)